MKPTSVYKLIALFAVLLVWELLLPHNPWLPQPSVALRAAAPLTSQYSLLLHLLSTSGVFAGSLALSAVLMLAAAPYIKPGVNAGSDEGLLNLFYPGSLVIIFLLLTWAPGSVVIDFIMISLVQLVYLVNRFRAGAVFTSSAYRDALMSLSGGSRGMEQKFIRSAALPFFFRSSGRILGFLWVILIFFEYVKDEPLGIGYLFKLSVGYWNVSYLLVTGFASIVIFYLVSRLFRLIDAKFVHSVLAGE